MEPLREPVPPFTHETALKKVLIASEHTNQFRQQRYLRVKLVAVSLIAAKDAWNSKNPELVSKAYTKDSNWRNRDEFFRGREKIVEFLTRKWKKENGYRLKKYLWCFDGNRIAVRFQYEWHNEAGQWFRSEGNENWQFDEQGYMEERWASINDVPISKEDRRIAVD